MNNIFTLIDKLKAERTLPKEEYIRLITCTDPDALEYLRQTADTVRKSVYGNTVYIRGLVEFTNYCKNDCLYCGIRRSNTAALRFRLTEEQILDCAEEGYRLGFRTIVLQGGEDPHFTDARLIPIVQTLRNRFPDCAITLSVGERSRKSYEALFAAGANRFLLRHETANACHYAKLHPEELTLANRMRCLRDLRDIGYQVGCGFMVGSPWQTAEHIAEDLLFLGEFKPHMVGIGPFIPHRDTPFRDMAAGTAEDTIKLLSTIRLILPNVLLPATTALGTISPNGRERGILAGANVIMPNLSPSDAREKYMLYNNKLSSGDEAAENLAHLKQSMAAIGYEIVTDRGDYKE
ncbi:MAG: [FeFe] hydrogenase H-cluster radical SAM maturase HydE [Ruminococcaceae bacterium]|nr:[FeFe] hydrogenase H-cluster radical SAM maturase HydE [Oscillospiraceae bacterium]